MGVAHLKIQMYLLSRTWITQVLWIMACLLPGPAYYSVWVLLCVLTALSPTWPSALFLFSHYEENRVHTYHCLLVILKINDAYM